MNINNGQYLVSLLASLILLLALANLKQKSVFFTVIKGDLKV